MLAIRMVAVLQRHKGLPVNLKRGHDPDHQSSLSLQVHALHQINRLNREHGLTAASWYFQAEGWQMASQPVPTRNKISSDLRLFPGLGHEVHLQIRICPSPLAPNNKLLKEVLHLLQRPLLVFL